MRKTAFSSLLLILSIVPLLSSCGRKTASLDQARHYDTRGIVQGISPDRQTIDIQHEDIPGFMPSMTMSFSVLDRKEIADLKIGAAISFRMTVTDKELVIDQVKQIAVTDVHLPKETSRPIAATANVPRLKEGDVMPVFSLTDQDGNRVTQDTLRGQPFVLTFIFTRCAVPNFCPLMSTNFAELQHAIKTATGPLAMTRLVSITLDPAFDTQQVLKEHGAFMHADSATWKFVTGDPKEIDPIVAAFSVYRETEGGTLSHGLATALVSADGTIQKIWRGNGWKPAEVIAAIETTNAH